MDSTQLHITQNFTLHIHLLVTPGTDTAVSNCMQYLGRYYVRYFNFQYGRTGTLFEGRFKSNPVQSNRYLLACYRYIELNPVRAGLVQDPADYVWSSYRANAFGLPVQMWSPHEEYLALGNSEKRRLKTYQQLFLNKIGSEFITEIRHALNTGLALGNDRFRAEVEKLTGQPQKHMKRGPKKRLFNRQQK
jgi:putative transposase